MQDKTPHPGKNEDTNKNPLPLENETGKVDKNNIDESEKNEVPDDPSIRELYDKDLNAATVHSSNADKTFGNEKRNENQNE